MNTRLVQWAVKTHPARYRAELGTELEDTALAAAAGRGFTAIVSEAASLAVHGLRLRTGLSSDRSPGRILAASAPAALALSIAGQSADRVLQANMFQRAMSWDQMNQAFGTLPALAGVALAALALAALLLGRVSAGRMLASAAAVLAVVAAVTSASYWAERTGMVALPLVGMGGPLLVCALLWLAPLRLLPTPGNRTAWLTAAAGVLAFAVLCEIPGASTWAVADLALLFAGAAAVRRTRRAAMIGLVALAPLYPPALNRLWEDSSAFASRLEAGLVASVVTAFALAVVTYFTRSRRPAGGDRDPAL
ncbi:hypothetical protein V2W30_39535 (plasmid) [Streptomyces sp. Q6]|uniref:Uncharacterized protein n=1 Tax=Streptomyces citrinus TaxID=3118173 RepID=A0ACD5AQ06_9ACTN